MNLGLQLDESIGGDIIMLDKNGNSTNNSINQSMDIDNNPKVLKQRKTSFDMSATGSLVVQSVHGPLKIHQNKGIMDKTQARISILENNNSSHNNNTKLDNILKDVSELKIISKLGSGISGSVYKCLHKPTNTLIAAKFLDINDKNKRQQFKDEIQLFLAYHNTNIVSFKGVTIDSLHCQVIIGLEYMENGSLETAINKYGKLNEIACKSISKDIINALCYLEKYKLIHRDIKPANILLNNKFIAKLADFGVVKSLQKIGDNTIMAKTQIGTMAFMGPERLMGKQYSYKSDIWSFGLTIMYCALGKFPYNVDLNGGPIVLLTTIIDNPPPKLPNNNNFSINFKSFLQACLYKDPNKRWKASDLLLHPFIST